MSQAVPAAEIRAEKGVVARSQYSNRVHRPDPDSDDPQPACHEADIDHADEYRDVAVSAVTPHYRPCGNPQCFGRRDDTARHLWHGPLANRPLRIQTFHIAATYLSFHEPPLTRRQVHALLAVESTERSIQRGLQDALALGWLTRGPRAHQYEPGPLAALFDDHTAGGRQYWRDSVTKPSRRVRGYHGAVVAALTDETPVTSRVVADRLDVSGERTLQRGLRDARDAGWLVWDEQASAYYQGPLAIEIGASAPHPHAGGGER